MCISHSVIEGQRHNNPLTRVAFVYNGPKVMELAPNPRYTGGLGGSFKLVMLTPKTVREMTQLPRETKDWGTHKQIKCTNGHTRVTVR